MSLTALFSDINLWAVLVAGIVHMLTGLIWFQTWLFGKTWSELTGATLTPAFKWMPAGVIGHMLIALVLAMIVKLAGATTLGGGILVGALVWLGFIVTLEIGELIWEKIPFKLFLIRIGNHLVALSLAGAILAVWR
jgi:hypothetical protein